ncbi:NAD(P)/FAD-dependent oxidoreductase [Nocardioides guangzhouensis]|uniref:NAD(P)/FAD-dependent oxidoreductase n=1 Tax=Nocardioides guangzhouensis TaxID=2497878 RepID=A0A4Q4Z5F5_9ACTN|nr:NAD(P)/FAD-dependent oxidoreductase [Nocardioides guangzhouensis]RYP82987.1 NAD(P)/FAD-dependent oxidoreductase [Nocardioides guangzhouensis]
MNHDVIVIGARVAGSPTAMLLARKGYRVLAIDRATFPSDTLSTHVIHAPGIAALRRWGLLDRLTETRCVPITTYSFDFGTFTIRGTTRPVDGVDVAYAPRRTILDKMLVDAAREAGAEVREGVNVDEVVVGSDGRVQGVRCDGTAESARVVIAADGRNSGLVKAVRPAEYHLKPRLQYGYYTYFSGLPTDGLENFIRPGRGIGCAPTHDGLTMLVMGWPYTEARAFKADVAGNFYATLELVPELADRVSRARQEAPFRGGAVPGWLRRPYGHGWALVGDAGYNKDPITAQGITDAFLDAEGCAEAVDRWLGGQLDYEEAMSRWHRDRDARVVPMYEFTSQMATLNPPPPELEQLLRATTSHREFMDAFVSVVSGALSPAEFFSDTNVGRVLAASSAA